MDASDIFNRGASIPRDVILTYEDTGLPIDLDDLDEIEFSVLHSVTTRELDNFKLSEGTVTKVDASIGHARFIVPQSVTVTAKRGTYYLNAITEETNLAYEDNTHIRENMVFCFKLNY